MTSAEAALRDFARTDRLRLSACHVYNPNVGEPAYKRTKVRKEQLVVTLHAADSLIACEARLPDGEFGFAVNLPDRVCGFDQCVTALRDVLAWPVFVGDPKQHERAVIRWVRAAEHRRLIETFALDVRESLQVYRNGLCVVVEAHRDLGVVVADLANLAAAIPPTPVAVPVDCTRSLPEDLRHLATYFAKWAVGDDEERAERISRSPKARRAKLRADVEPLLGRIDDYLGSFSEPLPECALRLGYLAELVAELRNEA